MGKNKTWGGGGYGPFASYMCVDLLTVEHFIVFKISAIKYSRILCGLCSIIQVLNKVITVYAALCSEVKKLKYEVCGKC